MTQETQDNRQSIEEDNSSTIPQPEGQDPIEDVRPSQAEGDRDTVEADLRDNDVQTQA
jgi:hypothetical protein